MRCAALAGMVAALVLLSGAAAARPASRSRVALDWRDVSDADVARCGLSRLRAATLERLVDEGHAVVDTVGTTGVRVRVASVSGGLEIVVRRGATSRRQFLKLAETCDATFVLEAISRIAELVEEVGGEESSVVQPAPVPAKEAFPALCWSLEGVLRGAHPRKYAMFGGGFSAHSRVGRFFELGARGELAGNARLDIAVLEATASVVGAWQPEHSTLGITLEAGPLLHIGSSSALTAREIDAIVAIGPRLRLGPFAAQLLGYLRARRIEHRTGGEVAVDTRHVGLIFRIGAQLFDS